MEKTERQINLIALLLGAERPRTLAQIRESLYADQTGEEAFKRMFERDKEDLRTLGVRIEMESIGAWDDGYVVRRDETLIPDLDLSPAEHAALMLAAEAWGDGMLGAASPRTAAMKLAAGAAEEPPAPWILPRVDARSPDLDAIADAIARRKSLTFRYRKPGAAEAEERTVQPSLLSFRKAWYVAGLDTGRGEQREFKLDRIDGAVKVAPGAEPDFELSEGVPERRATDPEIEALVAVEPAVVWWVERRPGVRRAAVLDDGRVVLAVDAGDEPRFVRWAAGLATSAEVLEPAPLRSAVAGHLRAIAEPA